MSQNKQTTSYPSLLVLFSVRIFISTAELLCSLTFSISGMSIFFWDVEGCYSVDRDIEVASDIGKYSVPRDCEWDCSMVKSGFNDMPGDEFSVDVVTEFYSITFFSELVGVQYFFISPVNGL